MSNKVDDKINELINDHATESEKAGVSRDVDETNRRIKGALEAFTKLDILASDNWGGLYYEAKILALREAVLEMAKGAAKSAKVVAPVEVSPAQVELEQAIEAAPAPKKSRKAKAAA